MKEQDILNLIPKEELTEEEILNLVPTLEPLLEAADVIPEEQWIPLQTEPKRFWESLFGREGPMLFPGVRVPQPGAVSEFRIQAIRTEAEKMLDLEEMPRRAASNLVSLHLLAAGRKQWPMAGEIAERLEIKGAPTWSQWKKAVVDGIKGDEYLRPWTGIKMVAMSPEALNDYNDFIARHKAARVADKVVDWTVAIGSGVAIEGAAILGAKRGLTRLAPSLKNMFDDVGAATLHRGFNDALETQIGKRQLAEQVFEAIEAGRMGTYVDDIWKRNADEILDVIGREQAGLLVDRILPKTLTKLELTDLARIVGYEGTPSNLKQLAKYIWDTMPEPGFRNQWAGFIKRHIDDLPAEFKARNADDIFANIFDAMHTGRAGQVPGTVAQAFIKTMIASGVPYVDLDELGMGILRKAFIERAIETGTLTKSRVATSIDALTFGRKSKLEELNDVELAALTDDISTMLTIPKRDQANIIRSGFDSLADAAPHRRMTVLTAVGGNFGGVPSWTMFERLGIPHAYDLIDEAVSDIHAMQIERGAWIKDVMKRYKHRFGKRWDDVADQVAGRLADEGPSAIVPGRFALISPDELRFIQEVVDEDRILFWDRLADIAEAQGRIGAGTGVPREQYYFRHRRKIIDAMAERAIKRKEDEVFGILPADYMIEKAMREKIPAGVNVTEFMARKSEDAIEYNWRATTSIAFKEELRKLYFEPAAMRMQSILGGMTDPVHRKLARQYSHDWIRYVRHMPSAWDDKMNDVAKFIAGKVSRGHWQLRQRSFERFLNEWRRLSYGGTIGANTRSIVKNLTQSILTVGTIGNKATLAGIESMFSSGGRRMLGNYRVMAAGSRLSMLDITNPRDYEKLLSIGFSAVDKYINCAGAGNGAMYYLINRSRRRMDELAKFAAARGYGRVTKANFWDALADAVEAGHFKDIVEAANRNIKLTQFSYNYWDNPKHLWGTGRKALFQFTTWPSGYFGSYLPQMKRQIINGVAFDGSPATFRQQFALVTYLIKTGAIMYIARELGYNMDFIAVTGPVPTGKIHGWVEVPVPVTPITETTLSLGEIGVKALRGDLKGSADAMKIFARSLWPYVPAGVTIQRGIKVAKEEAPLEYIFLPKGLEKTKEVLGAPRRPTRPKARQR